jgi:tetratricopeptide (TPR) repeat protein
MKPRQLCIPVLCILVAVGTLWTYQRNRVWGDAITLWQDCVVKSPNKARPYNNLGVALDQAGQSEAAIENYYAAIKINPYYGNAHYNLGSAFARKGQLNIGIAHMTRALELEPNNYEAHNNLGIALLIQGAPQKAATHFRKALEINANYASTMPVPITIWELQWDGSITCRRPFFIFRKPCDSTPHTLKLTTTWEMPTATRANLKLPSNTSARP